MWAAAQSHPAMVDLLLAHGAEVDARSTVNDWERMVTAEPRQKNLMPGGFTPLLYAARQGCLECAKRSSRPAPTSISRIPTASRRS